MTKRQKASVWVTVVMIVLGLGSYAAYSLMSKMDQVKELNGQIAEADEEGSVDPESTEPTTLPGGGGDDEPPDVAVDPSAAEGAGGSDNPGATSNTNVSATPTAKPQSTDKPAQPDAGKPDSSAGTQTPASTPSPAELEERKQSIDQSVTASMESLRATCKAKSSGLVAQIKAEIAADQDAAVDTLQKEFLGQVIEAEAECDSQFAELVGQAKAQYKAAGIAESGLPDWSTEYDNAKAEARSAALTEIAGAIQ
ncbi:hypothetical protein ACX1C1_06175 [Paenibacillus sp. strain BS8-2]